MQKSFLTAAKEIRLIPSRFVYLIKDYSTKDRKNWKKPVYQSCFNQK